jgi:pimeloyl-ACP methyl ester carboxylesterase
MRANWTKAARALACPTLLITADIDRGAIISPETARRITEMNSFICVAHIPGAGHHVRFENYAAYMDAVKGFLKEINAM